MGQPATDTRKLETCTPDVLGYLQPRLGVLARSSDLDTKRPTVQVADNLSCSDPLVMCQRISPESVKAISRGGEECAELLHNEVRIAGDHAARVVVDAESTEARAPQGSRLGWVPRRLPGSRPWQRDWIEPAGVSGSRLMRRLRVVRRDEQ